MFAVVWPLLGQSPADATTLGGHGLRWHAIRRPAPRVPRQGLGSVTRLPLQVVPLARVLCGVRAFPADWPILIGHAFQRYGANYPEAENAHRIEVAACRGLEQAALVFFPPTRDTFLPSSAPPPPAPVPAAAGRAEEEEGDEEEGDGVGVLPLL